MKIYLVTSGARPSNEQISKLTLFGDFKIIEHKSMTTQEVIEKLPDVEILLSAPEGITSISKELLQNLKNLKYVALLTVGTDWIDLKAAKEQKILVSNVKGANSESVAEHIWGMILDLSKRISEFAEDAKYKEAFDFDYYVGKEMFGKTIGIIGLGDIGKRVARIAKGFDMKILGFNKNEISIEGIEMTSMENLLERSDVVTICVPLKKETENLISDKELKLMKNGAILVNCARELIVNKNAVIEAIKSKKLFGYGLETKIMVKISPEDEYFKYPNILLTPHNAFNTVDAENKVFETAIKNIETYLSDAPQNLVN
jgi:glycerate dehydrogenase